MFSFKNPLTAWVIVIIIIIIVVIPHFPWPPPCYACGEFLFNYALPLVFGVLGVFGVLKNLGNKSNPLG